MDRASLSIQLGSDALLVPHYLALNRKADRGLVSSQT
jgi:hypothetical protein